MRGNRPHRVDSNQKSIVKALREIPGVSVFETHMVGRGFPDLVVSDGADTYLIELKSSPKEKLTLAEQQFQLYWQGDVYVCSTLDEILLCLGLTKKGRKP